MATKTKKIVTRKTTTKKTVLKKVIIRANMGGVHYAVIPTIGGYPVYKRGWLKCEYSHRIFYWEGAAATDELAVHGPSKMNETKICEREDGLLIQPVDICEIHWCSEAAAKKYETAEYWKFNTGE